MKFGVSFHEQVNLEWPVHGSVCAAVEVKP